MRDEEEKKRGGVGVVGRMGGDGKGWGKTKPTMRNKSNEKRIRMLKFGGRGMKVRKMNGTGVRTRLNGSASRRMGKGGGGEMIKMC